VWILQEGVCIHRGVPYTSVAQLCANLLYVPVLLDGYGCGSDVSVKYTLCIYGVSHREGCLYIGTPPCKIHTVYIWRISQGGVSVYRHPSL
jgi:hypothetical protein